MSRDTATPSFLVQQDSTPITLTVSESDASINNQGYTYDQAGFSYDQTGVAYGGLYQKNQDVLPFSLSALIQEPMNAFIEDIYVHPAIPPGPNNQTVVGPGWFMYVAHI